MHHHPTKPRPTTARGHVTSRSNRTSRPDATDAANTSYQRDLSISYERLAGLAQAAGRTDHAPDQLGAAVKIRNGYMQANGNGSILPRNWRTSIRIPPSTANAGGVNEA